MPAYRHEVLSPGAKSDLIYDPAHDPTGREESREDRGQGTQPSGHRRAPRVRARRFEKVGKQVCELAVLEVELSRGAQPRQPRAARWPRRPCTSRASRCARRSSSRDIKHSINLIAEELARQVKRHRDKRRRRREQRAAAQAPPPQRRGRTAGLPGTLPAV